MVNANPSLKMQVKPSSKNIERLIRKVKSHPTTILIIKNLIDVYRIGGEGNVLSSGPLYRIAFANIPNAQDTFTVLDKAFSMERGQNEITIKKIPTSAIAKLKKYETWKDQKIGEMVRMIDSFDSKYIFKQLQNLGLQWTDCIDYLLDDTGKKDKRIIDVFKAQFMPLPMEPGVWQQFNNHSIILTNSGVAKTITSQRLTGQPTITDPTIPGLIGSEMAGPSMSGTTKGLLNGTGMISIDEFPESDDPIVNDLLNYIDQGLVVRGIRTPVRCEGVRCIQFLGNSDYKCSGEMLLKNIITLSTGKTLSRVGRRFAHILYGNEFRVVSPQVSDVNVVAKIRNMIKSIINQNNRVIDSIFRKSVGWLQIPDKGYKDKMLEMATLSKEVKIQEFIRGMSTSSPRIKLGAIKWAMLDNLDSIAFSRKLGGAKVIYKNIILPQAKQNYEKLKEYNYMSFGFVEEGQKSVFKEMFAEGVDMEYISYLLNKSMATLYRWRKKIYNV